MMYAAAIAFYTLFSFFPLILILLNLGGVFIHRFGLETQIVESVRFYLPVGADLVEDNLRRITASTGPTSLIALFLLTWTASGAFIPLELALNRAWGVKKERNFLFQRVVAASMALLCGTFILASVFATAMIGRFDRFVRAVLPKAGKLALTGIAFESSLGGGELLPNGVRVCADLQDCPLHQNSILAGHSGGNHGGLDMGAGQICFHHTDSLLELQERLWLHCYHHHDPELGLPVCRNPAVLR